MSETASHLASGKVREIYALDDERLLLVASDRISTFDVVLPTEIPDKGRVLTGLSGFWFAQTASIVPNHLLGARSRRPLDASAGRLEMLPIECVVRGYLAGSGWKDYLATGEVCGHRLPAGLDRVGAAARADLHARDEGADRPRREHRPGRRGRARRRGALRRGRAADARALPLRRRARAASAGSSSPTRSSSSGSTARAASSSPTRPSRPTPRASGRPTATSPAGAQPSYDKQFVRDYCEALGWDKTYPGPELPADVVEGTRARYIEAFERLTGIEFADYLADPSVVLGVRATVLVRPKAGILDPQGQAVESSLRHLGFAVEETRVGRLVELELATTDEGEARDAGRADVRAAAREPADRELRDRAARSRLMRRRAAAADRGRRLSRARTTTATPSSPSPRLGADARRVWHTETELPGRHRRRRPPRRVLLRRLPPLRRDRPLLADHAGRRPTSPPTAGSCSASATASRSSPRRGCSRARSGPNASLALRLPRRRPPRRADGHAVHDPLRPRGRR